MTNGRYSRVAPPVLLCAEAQRTKRQDEHEEIEALRLENAELRVTLEHLCNEIDALESEVG